MIKVLIDVRTSILAHNDEHLGGHPTGSVDDPS